MNSVRLALLFLLLTTALPGYADARFGRFFTTPAQRQKLDQLRMQQDQQKLAGETKENIQQNGTSPMQRCRQPTR